MRAFRSFIILPTLLAAAIVFGTSPLSAQRVFNVSSQGQTIYFPDEPFNVRITFVGHPNDRLRDPVVRYRVVDYWGEERERGEIPLNLVVPYGGNVSFETKAKLGVGWYRVELELWDHETRHPLNNPNMEGEGRYITLAVVPPPAQGPKPDSFFGIAGPFDQERAKAMARAGARWFRTDTFWDSMQSGANEPLRFDRLDEIVETMERFDIQTLLIVDYGASWAGARMGDDGSIIRDPRNPPRTKPWQAYVEAVASRYQGRVAAWEIWNEPNLSIYFLGGPSDYARLLREAFEAIRATDPHTPILFGGMAGPAWSWHKDILRALPPSAAEKPPFDAFNIHTYSDAPPERGLMRSLQMLRPFIGEAAQFPKASEMPLWITEMGYETVGAQALSEIDQAAYVVRSMTEAWAGGAEKFFWFTLADSPQADLFHGLLYENLAPKPSYVAYAVMERQLSSADFAGRLVALDPRVRAYLFETSEGPVLVAWSFTGTPTLSWTSDRAVEVVDLLGTSETPSLDGVVAIGLDSNPRYVKGEGVYDLLATDGVQLVTDPLAHLAVDDGVAMGENRVKNPSFDRTTAGGELEAWRHQVAGGAETSWEHRTTDAGEAYVRLTHRSPWQGNRFGRIYQDLMLEPYSVYTLSARLRTQGAGTAWIGGGPGWALRYPLPDDTQGAWVWVEHTFETLSEGVWPLMILVEDVIPYVDVAEVAVRKLR